MTLLKRARSLVLPIGVALSMLLMLPSVIPAEQKKEEAEKKPERLIEMAVEYPVLVVPPKEEVSMDIIFYNRGRSNEDVEVWIDSQPKNWKARIKTYRFTVRGTHVPSDQNKTVTFEAIPDDKVKPGEYEFQVKSKTLDGKFNMAKTIVVKVEEKEKGTKEARGVKLTTSYPVLRGPSDAKFEFSVEVESKLDKDAVFDLSAQSPDGWTVNFKPRYEDKYFSSIRLKSNQSETVAVEVRPLALAKAGEYPIQFRVTSGEARAEAMLKVIITGTYALEAGTPTGLLSLEAKQGKPANLSFYIKNTGTATNHDIKFMSFKPENWKVELKPEKIASIEPGELKQVEAIITPYEEALVGDYSVAIDVEGEKAKKNLEFRVTVRPSTAWGWIGIGIIVAVVAGLAGLFRWLGRR
ncbi:MAG: COG1470 family protein [Thermodesulfobacteriota bacterium]